MEVEAGGGGHGIFRMAFVCYAGRLVLVGHACAWNAVVLGSGRGDLHVHGGEVAMRVTRAELMRGKSAIDCTQSHIHDQHLFILDGYPKHTHTHTHAPPPLPTLPPCARPSSSLRLVTQCFAQSTPAVGDGAWRGVLFRRCWIRLVTCRCVRDYDVVMACGGGFCVWFGDGARR